MLYATGTPTTSRKKKLITNTSIPIISISSVF
jgi:hypothetical protein